MNPSRKDVPFGDRSRPFDRDRMNQAPARKVASAAMTVIDALQLRFTSEQQVLGTAAVFLILCERFGVEPQDAFTATKNLMNTVTGKRAEFEAVADYARFDMR